MPSITTTMRSARLGLRATPEQETVLRRAAEMAHRSLTGFILDAAVRLPNRLCSISACFWYLAASIRRSWKCWSGQSRSIRDWRICFPGGRLGLSSQRSWTVVRSLRKTGKVDQGG